MRFTTVVTGVLALIAPAIAQNVTIPPRIECGSMSAPNTIYKTWPNNVTGVLNRTTYILPIPLETARKYIPKEWGILTRAYQDLLPNLPKDTYPAVLQLVHDHDIRFGQVRISDFQRGSIEFPFVDLLNDRGTGFRWVGKQFISSDKAIALGGVAEYGTVPVAAVFNPSCNAYNGSRLGRASFKAQEASALGDAFLDASINHLKWTNKTMPLDALGGNLTQATLYYFFKNVTTQPVFGDGLLCNTQLYPTTDNGAPAYARSFVRGDVKAKGAIGGPNAPTAVTKWPMALGYRQPTQFIETNGQVCKTLQGYSQKDADRILCGGPCPADQNSPPN